MCRVRYLLLLGERFQNKTAKSVLKPVRLAHSVSDARDVADKLAKCGIKLQLGSAIHDPADSMDKLFSNILCGPEGDMFPLQASLGVKFLFHPRALTLALSRSDRLRERVERGLGTELG